MDIFLEFFFAGGEHVMYVCLILDYLMSVVGVRFWVCRKRLEKKCYKDRSMS